MRPMEVQYITREMLVRLGGPDSLLVMTLTIAEHERAAARRLVVCFVVVVAGFGLLLFGVVR